MTLTNSKSDGIDGYNESVWRTLGHPAFESDVTTINEDIEWWDINDESEADS